MAPAVRQLYNRAAHRSFVRQPGSRTGFAGSPSSCLPLLEEEEEVARSTLCPLIMLASKVMTGRRSFQQPTLAHSTNFNCAYATYLCMIHELHEATAL